MPKVLSLVLSLLLGIVVGAIVNMALVLLGPILIPPPPGADMTSAEGLRAAMPLLGPRHFLMPFLAHAVGTLAGAFAGSVFAAPHRAAIAYAIGGIFLCGGIAASLMIPAPSWFIALDLVVAYLPMAWLGLAMAERLRARSAT